MVAGVDGCWRRREHRWWVALGETAKASETMAIGRFHGGTHRPEGLHCVATDHTTSQSPPSANSLRQMRFVATPSQSPPSRDLLFAPCARLSFYRCAYQGTFLLPPTFTVPLPAFCRLLVYFSSTCRLPFAYHALLPSKSSGRANLATNPALMGR